MPRSNLVNAVDVALADPVTGVDSTIRVISPELLPAVPFYLVIDPFGDSSREYLFATVLTVDVLTVTRDLEGSQSTNHAVGDIVRITYAAQHLEDVWDAVEAIPAPVPQTYLHADLTDVSSSDHHVKTPDQTFLHDDLTDVTADQHHAKYTDAEAVAAVGDPGAGVYLPLSGGTIAGQLHIAVANGIIYDNHTTNEIGFGWTSDPSTISAYVDSQGPYDLAMRSELGAYLALTGGTMTGHLTIHTPSVKPLTLKPGNIPEVAGEWSEGLDLDLFSGNGDYMKFLGYRVSAGNTNTTVAHLITRLVDATWMGGVALHPGWVEMYAQSNSIGPYTTASTLRLSFNGVQFDPNFLFFGQTFNTMLPVGGSNETGMYFGVGTGNSATGAIESSWDGGQPSFEIGMVRDSYRAGIKFNYGGTVELKTDGAVRVTIGNSGMIVGTAPIATNQRPVRNIIATDGPGPSVGLEGDLWVIYE
ncbi:MAG: hypothetical protein DRH08_13255 [Deltaproteobacteria bacterium]|nr:MAG: hypothetical protein DRH08_13255 [Deltaproteobacteria bacterium]